MIASRERSLTKGRLSSHFQSQKATHVAFCGVAAAQSSLRYVSAASSLEDNQFLVNHVRESDAGCTCIAIGHPLTPNEDSTDQQCELWIIASSVTGSELLQGWLRLVWATRSEEGAAKRTPFVPA